MGMWLTTEQAAVRLGVTKSVVARLARTGQLATLNTRKDGAKRVEWRFDPAVVKEFKKTYVPLRHGGSRAGSGRGRVAAAPQIVLPVLADGPGLIRQQLAALADAQNEIQARLAAVEAAVNVLIEMWK